MKKLLAMFTAIILTLSLVTVPAAAEQIVSRDAKEPAIPGWNPDDWDFWDRDGFLWAGNPDVEPFPWNWERAGGLG